MWLGLGGGGTRWSRLWALALGGLWVSCAVVWAGAVTTEHVAGQTEVHFSDPERVQLFLDNHPDAAVKLLESVLSQEQVTALEKAMFPEPSEDEKRSAYETVQATLKRIGLGADDALLQNVSARIESLGKASPEGDTP